MTEYHCPTCSYQFELIAPDNTQARRGPWCYRCDMAMIEPTAEEKIKKALEMAKRHNQSTVVIPVTVLEELFNFEEVNGATV